MGVVLYKIVQGGVSSGAAEEGRSVQAIPHDERVRLCRMPGGEWHIAGADLTGPQLALIRGASAEDLVATLVWADAVHRDRGTTFVAIPYLPGARQDRRRRGEALSARVYADLINACRAQEVVCFDPHSEVMPALISRCIVVPPSDVVPYVLALNKSENIEGVVIPDSGATKRATAVANALGVPTFQALKRRDAATGQVSVFSCESLPSTGRLLVVDDICDSGSTPIALAKAMRLPRERLALYASHGVFSGGRRKLSVFYSAIYTTNSHPGATSHFQKDRKPPSSENEYTLSIFPFLLQSFARPFA